MGFPDVLKPKIRELSGQHRGLVLACGPPDSGTTTLAYCMLRSLDAYLFALYTIGDTSGHSLTNITAFDVNEGDDLATTLRRCIRVESHVIFLDPIRDAEAAKAVFAHTDQVAMMSEMTAKDPTHAIAQLVKWVAAQVVLWPKETAGPALKAGLDAQRTSGNAATAKLLGEALKSLREDA